MLKDGPDHYRAQGRFRRMLGDCSPWLHVICTHIQLRNIYLGLATRLIIRLPASPGTTSVRCTCQCISYRLYDDWILNVTGNSSKTLAPHAYVTYYQARGLSGHTSPCGECVYFIDPYALTVGHNCYCTRVTYISFQKYKWAHFIRKEIFFLFSLEHHAFFGQPESLAIIVVYCSLC